MSMRIAREDEEPEGSFRINRELKELDWSTNRAALTLGERVITH